MLIDLHCHTLKTKDGDGDGRAVSDELFAEKVKGCGVQILAITNHNCFDVEQFSRLQIKVEDDCRLWPGVELDIGYGDDGGRYHLLVVCNPKNIHKFNTAVREIIGGYSADDFIGDIETVVSKFQPLDCLFLPHFHKSPEITEEEFIRLESLLANKNRLIAEATNVRSMGIFTNHGITSIAGSDIKDWQLYPNMELPELRLKVEEYEHFCNLLDRDSAVVKTLLDKNTTSTYEVYPCKGNREVSEKHSFYSEINVIFGDKGTGKTEVIKSLVNKLKTEDIPFSKYISSETIDDLEELLDTSDMERSAESLGINDCEDDFSTIIEWGDKTPTLISAYYEYHRTYSARANQQAIGWSRASDMSDDVNTRLEHLAQDLERIDQVNAWLDEIKISDYLSATETAELTELVKKLSDRIDDFHEKIRIESKALELVNFTIDSFRTLTSAKTGSAARPANTGFEQYAKNRLKLDKSLERISSNLAFKERKTYTFLGSTGGKGNIEIEHRLRMINNLPETKSIYQEYDGNVTKLHKIIASIAKVSSLRMSLAIDDSLAELKDQLIECDIKTTGDFIGIYKQTVDKNREPYSLSSGERSIIFIQRALEDKDAKVFLLDEPELSMANSYIDEVIRPRIVDLGKQKKTIIMATHNANLAVRTLPYKTIYRSHDSRGYNTYIGNPFTNKLINVNDPTDTLDWKDTSMKILEGGKEAFYDREGIYESGR